MKKIRISLPRTLNNGKQYRTNQHLELESLRSSREINNSKNNNNDNNNIIIKNSVIVVGFSIVYVQM
ncbi:hypothetical protein RRG08_024550 [Elysia crispata]|uniref:Uncharacterized protein n=1 Tax=Elysia crispata TaxID=231223 RepID=A0AAE1A6P9_9GAST|nr:hypothetical protein RRG08_024550 [Elysia crispata]